MGQRLLWLLVRLTLILSLMVLSMVPLDAFAGTTASANHSAIQHRPHFFMDGELSVVGGHSLAGREAARGNLGSPVASIRLTDRKRQN